jgi:hypothetical protein
MAANAAILTDRLHAPHSQLGEVCNDARDYSFKPISPWLGNFAFWSTFRFKKCSDTPGHSHAAWLSLSLALTIEISLK